MEVKKGPILAVDPGREKCGVAIVDEGKTLLQERWLPAQV